MTFRDHTDCLFRVAPAVRGRGSPMIFSMLLEGLQALAPDLTPNLMAAIDGAGGVLAAALLAELFIRVRSRRAG